MPCFSLYIRNLNFLLFQTCMSHYYISKWQSKGQWCTIVRNVSVTAKERVMYHCEKCLLVTAKGTVIYHCEKCLSVTVNGPVMYHCQIYKCISQWQSKCQWCTIVRYVCLSVTVKGLVMYHCQIYNVSLSDSQSASGVPLSGMCVSVTVKVPVVYHCEVCVSLSDSQMVIDAPLWIIYVYIRLCLSVIN